MPFRRTDVGHVTYPKGISASDRQLCRRFFDAFLVLAHVDPPNIVVACSGGLDSTVLAHACAKSRVLKPERSGKPVVLNLAYVNHQLRGDKEINQEIHHIFTIGNSLGYDDSTTLNVSIPESGNVQAQAREARYAALSNYAEQKEAHTIFVAHHANDVVETKLWQFLTGRPVTGISRVSTRACASGWLIEVKRPLIDFTREEVERYASIWGLEWREDSSNETNKYARNRIRKELIPWVQKEINPGLVKTLCKG